MSDVDLYARAYQREAVYQARKAAERHATELYQERIKREAAEADRRQREEWDQERQRIRQESRREMWENIGKLILWSPVIALALWSWLQGYWSPIILFGL